MLTAFPAESVDHTFGGISYSHTQLVPVSCTRARARTMTGAHIPSTRSVAAGKIETSISERAKSDEWTRQVPFIGLWGAEFI